MPAIETSLVIGGGIAGLSAAIALARAGVICEVIEISQTPLGSSLGISGRAAEALNDLGIYDACCETGRPFAHDSKVLTLRDAHGQLISAPPERPQWPGAKANVAVYRPVFLKIMSDAAEALGVKIRRGVTANKITELGDRAVVEFLDGSEGTYDLVIGADGISSSTRAMIFPDAPKPAYSGQMSVRWMSPGPMQHEEGWYVSPAGRLGYYYLPHQNLLYVPAHIDFPHWERLSKESLYAIFENLLDSFTAPAIKELRLRLRPDAELIGRPFEWIMMPDPWYRGSVLLIGDAAHATTAHMGMGGGMALEDAVVLGQCVTAAATREEALKAFMARRYDRVRTVVQTSVTLSRLELERAPPAENRAAAGAAFKVLAEPY